MFLKPVFRCILLPYLGVSLPERLPNFVEHSKKKFVVFIFVSRILPQCLALDDSWRKDKTRCKCALTVLRRELRLPGKGHN